MSLAVALVAHLVCFIAGVALVWQSELASLEWFAWYFSGAAALAVAHWVPAAALRSSLALRVAGFSVVLAAWFWGANFALDQLGNSVPNRHVGAGLAAGLPLHFVLFPGVFAFGVGSWVHGRLRRHHRPIGNTRFKAGGT